MTYSTIVDRSRTERTRIWLLSHKSLIVLVLLSCNTLVWFDRGLPIGFSDGGLQTMFYDPGLLLRYSLHAWSGQQLGGVPTYANISLVPMIVLALILKTLGIGIAFRQAIIFYCIELAGMISCKWWLSTLLRNTSNAELISFSGSVFYSFNMMTALVFWFWDKLNITTVAAVPLLLMAIEMALRSETMRGTLALALSIFVGSSLFLDGVVLVPVVFLCAAYAAVRVIQLSPDFRGTLMKVSKFVVSLTVGLIINAWVVLPFIATSTSYYSNANGQINGAAALQNATDWSAWSSLLRFLPFGDTASGAWLYKLPQWRGIYTSPEFKLIGYSTLIILLIAVVGRDARKLRLTLGSFFVVGIALQGGAKGVLGPFLRWLVDSVPYGNVLRTPWRSIAPVTIIAGAGLFGLGITSVFVWLKARTNRRLAGLVYASIMALICGVYAFPLWTGQIISSPIRERGGAISSYVQIPQSYHAVAAFLSKDTGSFRVLSLPLSPTSYYTSDWPSGYDGSDQRWLLFNHPTISFLAGGAFPAVTNLASYVEKSDAVNFQRLVQIAEILSCKYIVIDGYMQTNRGGYYGQILHSPGFYADGLELAGFKPIMTSGKLTVFELPSSLVLPEIFATRFGTANSFVNGVELSPVKYDVRVPTVSGKELVTLNQNFDPGWRAVAYGNVDGEAVKLPATHVKVNNIGNGWIVTSERKVANVTIAIDYAPQKWMSYGAELTLLSILGVIIAALTRRGRSPKRLRRPSKNVRRLSGMTSKY